MDSESVEDMICSTLLSEHVTIEHGPMKAVSKSEEESCTSGAFYKGMVSSRIYEIIEQASPDLISVMVQSKKLLLVTINHSRNNDSIVENLILKGAACGREYPIQSIVSEIGGLKVTSRNSSRKGIAQLPLWGVQGTKSQFRSSDVLAWYENMNKQQHGNENKQLTSSDLSIKANIQSLLESNTKWNSQITSITGLTSAKRHVGIQEDLRNNTEAISDKLESTQVPTQPPIITPVSLTCENSAPKISSLGELQQTQPHTTMKRGNEMLVNVFKRPLSSQESSFQYSSASDRLGRWKKCCPTPCDWVPDKICTARKEETNPQILLVNLFRMYSSKEVHSKAEVRDMSVQTVDSNTPTLKERWSKIFAIQARNCSKGFVFHLTSRGIALKFIGPKTDIISSGKQGLFSSPLKDDVLTGDILLAFNGAPALSLKQLGELTRMTESNSYADYIFARP